MKEEVEQLTLQLRSKSTQVFTSQTANSPATRPRFSDKTLPNSSEKSEKKTLREVIDKTIKTTSKQFISPLDQPTMSGTEQPGGAPSNLVTLPDSVSIASETSNFPEVESAEIVDIQVVSEVVIEDPTTDEQFGADSPGRFTRNIEAENDSNSDIERLVAQRSSPVQPTYSPCPQHSSNSKSRGTHSTPARVDEIFDVLSPDLKDIFNPLGTKTVTQGPNIAESIEQPANPWFKPFMRSDVRSMYRRASTPTQMRRRLSNEAVGRPEISARANCSQHRASKPVK